MTKIDQIATVLSLLNVQREIAAILEKHKVSAEQGEVMLLWMAGAAAGLSQRPILKGNWVEPAWLGWQAAASQEPIE